MNQDRVLDISWSSILKIALVAILFYIFYLVRDILILFIFALIISFLFNPLINFFQKRKVPRVLAVIFIYLGIFGFITILIYFLSLPLVLEIRNFLQIFPEYFEKISPPLRGLGIEAFKDVENFIEIINKTLERMAISLFGAAAAIFGGILSTLFVLSLAIFLSLEEKGIERGLTLFFPKKYETFVLNLWLRTQKKVSGWFLSRILSSLFVAIASYFAFLIFKINYSLSLAILAGILNFIPFIGPIITGILILILVSLDSLSKAIFALIVFILIQQIENNILSPILTKRFVELSSTLVLISLAIGGKLLGFWGAILAIPLAGIFFEFFRDYLKKRKEETPAF